MNTLSLTHHLWLSCVPLFIVIHIVGSVPPSPLDAVCAQIQNKLSTGSAVYYPGNSQYGKGISHYSLASTQRSKCVVEPGSDQDVAVVLRIVGQTRTAFAIKGGGHATNPGFSSTTGVHISMTRFSQVTYQAFTETAEIGMGLIWDDVYTALEPYNRTVLGGRGEWNRCSGIQFGWRVLLED